MGTCVLTTCQPHHTLESSKQSSRLYTDNIGRNGDTIFTNNCQRCNLCQLVRCGLDYASVFTGVMELHVSDVQPASIDASSLHIVLHVVILQLKKK